MKISLFWLRIMGLSGIFGGLLLFAGDLLFYYDKKSTDLLLNMANASNNQITLSAFTALFSVWFYLFGLGQVYVAFKTVSTKIRNIVMLSFASILIAYGIIHAAYLSIAISAKLAIQHQINIDQATQLASNINNMLRLIVYPIFALLSILFIHQVWKRKTLYPRWVILFFPTIPFLFQGLLNRFLTGSLWVIFVGGFLNLILVLFFTASTISLWNLKQPYSK